MGLALLIIVGIILFLAGFIYFTLILPVFLMVDCSNSQVKQKSAWVVAMLVLWPIAGIFFGIIHSQKKWLRVSSWLSVISLFVVIIGVTKGIQYFKNEASTEERLLKTQISSNAPLMALAPDLRAEIEKDLESVYKDLREDSWLLKFEAQAENIRIMKKLNTQLLSGPLSVGQAQEWLEYYRSKKIKP